MHLTAAGHVGAAVLAHVAHSAQMHLTAVILLGLEQLGKKT